MPQNIRDVMTSNPCTIDADRSVAYAAKMMRDEDVGLAPIVEGNKLIGMLTDRDIAVRVAAQGRDPGQVKVRDVASKQLVTIDPQQDLDEALRIMAKHQVRRLPVVEKDGRLIGVVAQADIAREGDDSKTGQLVEEISESGGQMSSFEEGQFPTQVESPQEGLEVEVGQHEEQVEEEGISKVQASRPRRRSTSRKKSTTSRKKATGTRKKRSTGTRKKASTSRKRSTGTRKRTTRRSTVGRKRKTTTRKKAATSRKRSTGARKKSTGARKTGARKTGVRKTGARKTGARKRKTTTRKKASTSRKRSTGTRKKSTGARKTGTRKRKTTTRKSTGTRKRSTTRRATGRTTVRAAGRKGGRKTARKRTTRRKTR
jgi:CBS domain-containing protein